MFKWDERYNLLLGSHGLWYMFNTSSAVLEGKNRGRCGTAYNNAVCTTDAKLWPKSELGVEIGPGILYFSKCELTFENDATLKIWN